MRQSKIQHDSMVGSKGQLFYNTRLRFWSYGFFKYCDFSIHLSNMLYLFLPVLALKFMILHSFKIFNLLALILISSPIFVLLFGGLSELHFLQILYAQKVLDVQFPTILGSFDLELWSSRYCARKEGDVVLKNFVTFFLEIFISSNPEQISSSPFDENYLRPCSLRWSNPFIPVFAQSVQFICTKLGKKLLVFP